MSGPWRNDLEQDTRNGGRVLIAVGISIVVHLLLVVFRVTAPLTIENPENKDPIEVVVAPPEPPTPEQERALKKMQQKLREQQMAETEDANNKDIDPNAQFMSDRNQTAKQQTRAKSTDDFRKQTGTGSTQLSPPTDATANIPPTGDQTKKEAGQKTDDPALAAGEGDLPKSGQTGTNAGAKRDWKTLSLKDLSVGGDGGLTAATDDKLDDVATGDRTILSTREFRYFSYYHRIKELLRQYWKPSVEQKLTSLWAQGKNLGEDELVTKVLVLLDEGGKIRKISRVGTSGVNELDDAAVESFEKAGPFPNPPKGIVDKDGLVRIRWDFILKTEAAPRIQFATPGAAGPGQRRY